MPGQDDETAALLDAADAGGAAAATQTPTGSTAADDVIQTGKAPIGAGSIANIMGDPDRVSVTWGEEKYSPVSYNTFGLGPFYMSTKVRPGETPQQACERAWKYLDDFARGIYTQKRNGFIERLRQSGEM